MKKYIASAVVIVLLIASVFYLSNLIIGKGTAYAWSTFPVPDGTGWQFINSLNGAFAELGAAITTKKDEASFNTYSGNTAARRGAANGTATLNGSALVVQNPASASTIPSVGAIPISSDGTLNAWVTSIPWSIVNGVPNMVFSFNGRSGNVVPIFADYSGSYAAKVSFGQSVVSSGSIVTLAGDSASPGNSKVYGTNGAGAKGWYNLPTATGVPAGGVTGQVLVKNSNADYDSGWTTVTGTGTVTNFSSGNLTPLFTAAVTNSTTAPALAYTLSSVAPHKFFGNNSGITTTPGYHSINEADVTNLSSDLGAINTSLSGKVPTTTTVNSKPLSGNITLAASDVGAVPTSFMLNGHAMSGTSLSLTGADVGALTSLAVTSANGFGGTVANPTSTPAITITTPVVGIMKGNGTGASAASPGDADYILPAQTGHSGQVLTTNGTASSWAGMGYCPLTSGTSILKGDGAGGTTTLVNGTDYFSATLAANINMPTAGVWYNGPSISLTAGTWLVGGSVSVYPTAGVSNGYSWQLSDGTNSVCGCSIVNTGTGFTLPAGVDFVHVSASTTWKVRAKMDVQGNGAYITAGSTKIWGWRIGP